MSAMAKKEKRLQKAGYIKRTKKFDLIQTGGLSLELQYLEFDNLNLVSEYDEYVKISQFETQFFRRGYMFNPSMSTVPSHTSNIGEVIKTYIVPDGGVYLFNQNKIIANIIITSIIKNRITETPIFPKISNTGNEDTKYILSTITSRADRTINERDIVITINKIDIDDMGYQRLPCIINPKYDNEIKTLHVGGKETLRGSIKINMVLH